MWGGEVMDVAFERLYVSQIFSSRHFKIGEDNIKNNLITMIVSDQEKKTHRMNQLNFGWFNE